MSVFICGPSSTLDRRRIMWCPVCERRRRHVVNYGGYWGVTVHCCGCGDSWMDSELLERPFAPRWRQESIRRAKAQYEAAASGPPPSLCDQGVCTDRCPEHGDPAEREVSP